MIIIFFNLAVLLIYVDLLEKNKVDFNKSELLTLLDKYECSDGYTFNVSDDNCTMYSTMIGHQLRLNLEKDSILSLY